MVRHQLIFSSNQDFFFVCRAEQGQYRCTICRHELLLFSKRLDWIVHMKAKHKDDFDQIVEELRSARQIVTEAIRNISSDDDDHPDQVRFSTALSK